MNPIDAAGKRPIWNMRARNTSAFTLVEHWHFMTGLWASKRRARRFKGKLKARYKAGER